jgi:hypothetical protein
VFNASKHGSDVSTKVLGAVRRQREKARISKRSIDRPWDQGCLQFGVREIGEQDETE